MAFRQPTHHAPPQRVYTAPVGSSLDDAKSQQSPLPTATATTRQTDESQEWVLFSPGTPSTSTRAYTTSLTYHHHPQTGKAALGRSRSHVSDYGSLDTAAQSYGYDEDDDEDDDDESAQTEAVVCGDGDGEDGEDDAELDSLDSHLHAFRAESHAYHHHHQHHHHRRPPTPDTADGRGNNTTVLPAHDGLGSFRIDQQQQQQQQQRATGGDEALLQAHLYAFEQHNPRRVKRRRESLERGQRELESGNHQYQQQQQQQQQQQHVQQIQQMRQAQHIHQQELDQQRTAEDAERTRRIEAWRAEQSRVLRDEIWRETRRRHRRQASESTAAGSHSVGVLDVRDDEEKEEEDVATMESVTKEGGRRYGRAVTSSSSKTTAAAETGAAAAEEGEGEGEGFWNRLTRKVIRDLIGIDDQLLCIIFGEALADEADDVDLSRTPPAKTGVAFFESTRGVEALVRGTRSDSWEHRLLERIAHELGLLVNQLADHPSSGAAAFSTYQRLTQQQQQQQQQQEDGLPYAGLPAIPEAARDVDVVDDDDDDDDDAARFEASSGCEADAKSSGVHFRPTLQSAVRPLGVAGQAGGSAAAAAMRSGGRATELHESQASVAAAAAAKARLDLERQYWEKDLDIKMVFRYLRSRFTSSSSSSSSPAARPALPSSMPTYESMVLGHDTARLATTSTPATAARAARVRSLHPLVDNKNNNKNDIINNKNNNRARPAAAAGERRSFRGNATGTASGGAVPLKRGGSSCASQSTRKSNRRTSGSSRHYWDFGGSIGSGSVIGPTAGIGSWGEV